MKPKGWKALYAENEAAAMLEVSVEQLRAMVKTHITKDDDVPWDPLTPFHASDLVVLKILLSKAAIAPDDRTS